MTADRGLCNFIPVCNFYFQVRTTALAFLKRMYEKDQLRDYIEKFALNYMQLLVHPNPPSLLFGADKDTGLEYIYLLTYYILFFSP